MMPSAEPGSAIRAPWSDDPALAALISRLRDSGEVVLQVLADGGEVVDHRDAERLEVVAVADTAELQ